VQLQTPKVLGFPLPIKLPLGIQFIFLSSTFRVYHWYRTSDF